MVYKYERTNPTTIEIWRKNQLYYANFESFLLKPLFASLLTAEWQLPKPFLGKQSHEIQESLCRMLASITTQLSTFFPYWQMQKSLLFCKPAKQYQITSIHEASHSKALRLATVATSSSDHLKDYGSLLARSRTDPSWQAPPTAGQSSLADLQFGAHSILCIPTWNVVFA